jgi:hypothetical protein
MFDNPAVFRQSDAVHAGPVLLARPMPEAVRHDVIAVSNDVLECDRLAGLLASRVLEAIGSRAFGPQGAHRQRFCSIS